MATAPLVGVRVPATTANLGPGFDAFGLALQRWLTVTAAPGGAGPRVATTGEGAHEVTDGDDNLVWSSLVRFCDDVGAAVPDVRLAVHNAIPLERGLGSSSAAIVAGLTLGRSLTGAPVADRRVVGMATDIEGHPDNVAAAVLGGLVACGTDDTGELVLRRGQPAVAPLTVFVPRGRQSTVAARAVLPGGLDRHDAAAQAARAGHVLAGLLGAWPVDGRLGVDRLHEPARFAVMPDAARLVAALRADGLHAWLSGAGPTVAAAGETARVEAAAAGLDLDMDRWTLDCDLAGAVACPTGGCAWGGGNCVQCPRDPVAWSTS